MSRRRIFVAVIFVLLLATLGLAQTPDQRHFQFHYKFSVRNVPADKDVRIWFPRAVSDDYQTVSISSVQSDLQLKRTRTGEYGDELFYAESKQAKNSEYKFDVTYDVVRREHKTNFATASGHGVARGALTRYLQADKLVPITGLPADIAAKQVEGKTTTVEKARALYDYTLANMKYDKTGTGWGRGDTLWACDAKRGNCTDFHSLFISMARSQRIPARFEIGFPLPAGKHESEIPGYHCWAEFYDQQHGWVPVDISEAWKDQGKKDYFFGAHDVNRIQFSTGRDIALNPRQSGEALNYFVYPYVEVDGKKWENINNQFSFADVSSDKLAASVR